MTASVLLLSVDPRRRARLGRELEALGFVVEPARWLAEARRRVGRRRVDVVLVDAESMDVAAAVADLGLQGDLPVVVLSSPGHRGAVAALEAGATDHVQEPADPDELAARLRAAARRAGRPVETPLVTSDFEIQFAERRVLRGGEEVHLTPTEWAIVELLARNQGQVVTQHRILTEVWGIEGHVRSGYVRVYMNTIRRKLEPDPAAPRYFITVHGVGVRLEAGDADGLRHPAPHASATRS